MTPSRNPIRGSIATVALLMCAAPVSAQTSAGTFALSGMTNPALWTSVESTPVLMARAPSPALMTPSTTATSSSVAIVGGTFLPETPIDLASSASRTTGPTPQAQDGGGGFPWLEVGIGAAVGALFIQAVATANSGDAAELPRGGISVVLPSS